MAREDLADPFPQRMRSFVLRLGRLLLAGEEVWQAVGPPQAVAVVSNAGAEAEALGVGELGDGVGAVLSAAVTRPLLGTQLAPAVTKFGVRTCSRKTNVSECPFHTFSVLVGKPGHLIVTAETFLPVQPPS